MSVRWLVGWLVGMKGWEVLHIHAPIGINQLFKMSEAFIYNYCLFLRN